MTILYALVARGTVVLAELSAVASGDASVIARRILERGGDGSSRVSYSQDRHAFHILKEDGLTFLCMASDTFGRRIPFAYLEDIHMRFIENYGKVASTAMNNDEFSRVLHQQMEWFSSNPDADEKGEIGQVILHKGVSADAAPPQLGADWEGSALPLKNTTPMELMDILAERNAALMEKNIAIAERDAAFAERDAAYAERDAAYAERDAAFVERDAAFVERDAALMEKNTASAERSAAYAERDAAILQRDIATAERDSASLNRDATLAALTRLEKKSSGRASRRPSSLAQATTLDGSKLLQRVDLAEHCTFAAEFHPDATPSSGIMVLGTESGVHRFSRDDKESQLEIFVRTKRKATEFSGRHPKKSRTPQVEEASPASEEPGPQAEVLNKRIFLQTPIPYCSCTGMNQQCYRWGNGGWQSACCTTLISTFPLPLNPKKRGSRVAGRKMSAGAFDKLLEKLVSEGVNINLPVDLREHWAKHGTNRYVTLR